MWEPRPFFVSGAKRVPTLYPDPELLAAYEARTHSRLGFQYEVKDGVSPNAMDVVADDGEIETDDAEMSIHFPFAAGNVRDRVGDYIEIGGIETANHERNPLAFLDHGKNFKYPLGLDQDRAKNYTVEKDESRGKAFAKTFIRPICTEHTQIYEFYKAGILRSGSIGYRTIQEELLPPDRAEGLPKGKHLIRVELIETSAVFLPCHQDAVLRMYDQRWDGKSLADSFRKILEPQRPRKKAWADGGADFDGAGNRVLLTVEVREKSLPGTKGAKLAPSPSPVMSTNDATAGGALVGPPEKTGDKDVPKEPEHYDSTDAEQDTSVPAVSHNAQRMMDLHYILQANKELHDAAESKIDENPHLLDHPDVKDFLNTHVRAKLGKLRDHTGKLQGAIEAKLAKTHPDVSLPDYGEKNEQPKEGDVPVGDTEEEKEREDSDLDDEVVGAKDEDLEDNENAADEDVTDPGTVSGSPEHEDRAPAKKKPQKPKEDDALDPEEVSGDAEHEDKPHKKKNIDWHAPILRNKGTPPVETKRMNVSAKNFLTKLHRHLSACAESNETPDMHKAAHLYYAKGLKEILGNNPASEGDPAMSNDAQMGKSIPQIDEDKAKRVFTKFKAFREEALGELRRMLKAAGEKNAG